MGTWGHKGWLGGVCSGLCRTRRHHLGHGAQTTMQAEVPKPQIGVGWGQAGGSVALCSSHSCSSSQRSLLASVKGKTWNLCSRHAVLKGLKNIHFTYQHIPWTLRNKLQQKTKSATVTCLRKQRGDLQHRCLGFYNSRELTE